MTISSVMFVMTSSVFYDWLHYTKQSFEIFELLIFSSMETFTDYSVKIADS